MSMGRRGEALERPFAHCYETGRMRRTHLLGHGTIRKRLLIHAGAGNLALLMRRLLGAAPRAPSRSSHARAEPRSTSRRS
jgi:hypothetical protein